MKRLAFIAALLLAGSPLTTLAAAGHGGDAHEAPQAGSQVPLSRVLAELAKRYGGKQLNTTMGEAGGRPAYLVQWQLANGRIVTFTIDAQTGQVVGN
jgi:uncharacterized membrane protein YkoI